MSKTYDERLKDIHDELDRNWINGMKEDYLKAADYLSQKDVLQEHIPLSHIVAPIHWRDPKTEKPEDGEMVLIYGRKRFTKQKGMELVTYEEKYATEPSQGFGEYHPFTCGVNVEKWLRIPPVE